MYLTVGLREQHAAGHQHGRAQRSTPSHQRRAVGGQGRLGL